MGFQWQVILYDNQYEQLSDKETDRGETMPPGIVSHGQVPYYSTKIREQHWEVVHYHTPSLCPIRAISSTCLVQTENEYGIVEANPTPYNATKRWANAFRYCEKSTLAYFCKYAASLLVNPPPPQERSCSNFYFLYLASRLLSIQAEYPETASLVLAFATTIHKTKFLGFLETFNLFFIPLTGGGCTFSHSDNWTEVRYRFGKVVEVRRGLGNFFKMAIEIEALIWFKVIAT